MFQVQKELKLLKKKVGKFLYINLISFNKQIDEETLKQKKDDKINILEEERDYFRAEALRLDKHCKDQQRVIEEIKFKNKILSEDRDYYEEFVIETKKENKALKTELIGFYANNKAHFSPKQKPLTAETDFRRTKATVKEENNPIKDSFFQTQPLNNEFWSPKEFKRLKEGEKKALDHINRLHSQLEKGNLQLKYNNLNKPKIPLL